MAGDASFASVISLNHFNGVNGATASVDQLGVSWAYTAGSALSNAHPAFGTTGLGTGSTLTATGDFSLSGDFTLEGWVYLTANVATSPDLFKIGNEATGRYSFGIEVATNRLLMNKFGSANVVFGTNAVPLNTLTHVAWARIGTTCYGFINGVLAGSTTVSGTVGNTATSQIFTPGNCYVDETRWTRGVGRYSANFAAPTAAFPDGMGQVSGTVKDASGANAARTVRGYRRDTGALVASTVSDGTTGAYSFWTPTLDEVTVVALDNASSGTYYDDICARTIPA